MRLMIEIGYQKLLLPEDADTHAVLHALAGAVKVEEKRGNYSDPARYVVEGPQEGTAAKFIPDSLLIDDENADAEASES